jgi:amidase
MLGEPIPAALPARLVVAQDAFGLADPETAAALQPMVRRLGALVEQVREDVMAPPGLTAWARAQRTLQPWEAWLTFQDWIDRDNPRMQWSVARNLVLGGAIPESERQWAALVRAEARARLTALLPAGTMLCLPTTPFPAPPKGQSLTVLEPLRARITCLAAHGGLTGLPQVSLPGAHVAGLPVGLSIVAARGSDATLVAVARAMEAAG